MLVIVPIVLAGYVVAGLDAYQAVTGRRLSKKLSYRTDSEMRRQSAIAAGVLGLGATVLLIVAISN